MPAGTLLELLQLHAATQTDIRTPGKVLARELDLRRPANPALDQG